MSTIKQSLDPSTTLIGVVGAGNMGAGIAQKYATEGFQVTVLDISEEAVARGQKSIEATLEEGVQRKIFRPEKRDQILAEQQEDVFPYPDAQRFNSRFAPAEALD